MNLALVPTRAGLIYKCPECGRVFDPTDETDIQEMSFGHDCEVEE